MIALAKVKETERLLATTELSQRKIAARVGISRATVAAIASGKHRDYEARLIARMEESQPLGPLARCAGCGGMVYMPCRLCTIRALKNRERQMLRAGRRAARELAVRRLLEAVRRAYWAREAAERAREV
jgi:transcriptional regulator with XRE-family HTH domain